MLLAFLKKMAFYQALVVDKVCEDVHFGVTTAFLRQYSPLPLRSGFCTGYTVRRYSDSFSVQPDNGPVPSKHLPRGCFLEGLFDDFNRLETLDEGESLIVPEETARLLHECIRYLV